ncbi:MAG: MBL fold metallo-hydrolase [Mediterranea sp.]|jgi:glyoxylase-like metal-dependent hydrolase (beta-lactamase superfamily II)|nr:MBL fold metallo-hydrolase [Mediterranea sp.]
MKIKIFEFNMFPVNTYVLWDDTKEAAIIDCGCLYEKEKQTLKEYITSNKLTVKHLLNTHLHLDHIFGNTFVVQTFGVQPEACQADEFWLEESVKQSRMLGFNWHEAPAPIGKYLKDGDTVSFGNTLLEAIHVPGHSPGSLVYYCKAHNCMFAGDVLFRGTIGRTDLMGGNFDTLVEGIRTRLLTLPPDTTVYPGHGAQTTIQNETMENPFFKGLNP